MSLPTTFPFLHLRKSKMVCTGGGPPSEGNNFTRALILGKQKIKRSNTRASLGVIGVNNKDVFGIGTIKKGGEIIKPVTKMKKKKKKYCTRKKKGEKGGKIVPK